VYRNTTPATPALKIQLPAGDATLIGDSVEQLRNTRSV